MKKNILIIGTGTIGEPLIGLLSDFKNKLNIDVYFNKRTPLTDEVAKVESLIKRGAKLVTSPIRKKKFENMGHFVCIRRANDISQEGNFIASPKVGSHDSKKFGTHHAKDAYDLFRTKDKFVNIFSSALKVNSQYMHVIRFDLVVYGHVSKENLINRFRENKFVALSHKTIANKVFSFGRDHGYYGRIFNQTVVSIPTLTADNLPGKTKISGFCFTPQDGNSLLSSVAAALYGLHGDSYINHLKTFDKFLFQNI